MSFAFQKRKKTLKKIELVASLNLSSWCLLMVEWIFLAVPGGCLRFVIVVSPDHIHILFLKSGILEILPSWYIQSLKPKGKGDCKNLIQLS